LICEHCKNKLETKSHKKIHINIAQPLKTHFFCSDSCRDKWCHQIQKRRTVLVYLWAIGRFNNNFYFLKKKLKTRNIEYIGANGVNSYFTSHLTQIEPLELKKVNGCWHLQVHPNKGSN